MRIGPAARHRGRGDRRGRGHALNEDPLGARAEELAAAVDRELAAWVVRAVERTATAWGEAVPADLPDRAREAGERARQEVVPALRSLLATDVDDQRTNPLALLRRAVRFPTAVLRAAGVPPVRRDEFAERAFPDDDYDLSPAAFADVHPSLHEPGLRWGAAKAYVVLRRRREGAR